MRTRVKICGITRQEDLHAAVDAGADAIGLVFYPGSKRAVTLAQARALREAAPAFVDVVALFVNATPADVRAVIDDVAPDLLQFHGDETPAYCDSFGRRYMRAFRVGAPGLETAPRVLAACQQFNHAAAWLFDSYSASYGGSGLALDVALLDAVRAAADSRPLVLAGGLKAETVRQSITAVRPYAVDVSSGVEVSPGIKSPEMIAAFMRAVSGQSA
ncbi:phosphoribosylanthranilate isomerase [Pusillimonas sp. TS35]|uniref:phosphoribosylanthranilate isomerase n=1 Tax=Paracandidimonas lactea TaxID=2895524 RepID=UPI00136DF513|nr:phosphoribosylanthranilate isomerase [Pusillimonas sp. TS35]